MNRRTQKLYDEKPQLRPFLRTGERTLLIAVAAVCLFLFVLRPLTAKPGATALVTLNGEEIFSIPLHEDDDYRIDLLPDHGVPVSFEVREGGIRYVDVTCPDHICEKTGVIRTDGQTAVCMPNRVAVVILADDG